MDQEKIELTFETPAAPAAALGSGSGLGGRRADGPKALSGRAENGR